MCFQIPVKSWGQHKLSTPQTLLSECREQSLHKAAVKSAKINFQVLIVCVCITLGECELSSQSWLSQERQIKWQSTAGLNTEVYVRNNTEVYLRNKKNNASTLFILSCTQCPSYYSVLPCLPIKEIAVCLGMLDWKSCWFHVVYLLASNNSNNKNQKPCPSAFSSNDWCISEHISHQIRPPHLQQSICRSTMHSQLLSCFCWQKCNTYLYILVTHVCNFSSVRLLSQFTTSPYWP